MSRYITARRMRLRALSLVLVTCFALLSCGSMPVADGSREIGMTVRLVDTDPATVTREFDLMASMHVSWVRADFDWSAIEVNHGGFNWAYPDGIVKEASARRMNVLPVLAYTPSWARPAATTSHTPPSHASDFAEFARAAAARYAPLGVHTWEIWNEPNINDFWQPAPDANKYGELFRAAAATIRGVDPTATVLTGGLTRGSDTADGSRISQTKYLEQLYANGTAQEASAIAVHPYSFPWLPLTDTTPMVGGFNDVPALQQVMKRHGDGGKKIWITEFGAPTGTASYAVTDNNQALSLVQARRQNQQWSWAGPLIYFELRDAGTDRAVGDDNFGVVRRDLSLKPAGRALTKQRLWP